MSTIQRSKSSREKSSVCQSSEFELLENEELEVLFFLFVPTCRTHIKTRNFVYILKRNMCTMNGCCGVPFGMIWYKKALTVHCHGKRSYWHCRRTNRRVVERSVQSILHCMGSSRLCGEP